jgi:hypothetical protein
LLDKPEIILFGKEAGITEIASQLNIKCIPDILYNEYGTPLLSSIFERVQVEAKYSTICYINSDIILTSSITDLINKIVFKEFLLLGQRWDIDITDSIDFSVHGWEINLILDVYKKGKIHSPWGSDYFIFPKGLIKNMPNFAVGRPNWDNWLIYYARSCQVPVIDLTHDLIAIHQNHDYSHVPYKKGEKWEGPEADENRKLMGKVSSFNLFDATHRINNDIIGKTLEEPYIKTRLSRQSILDRDRGSSFSKIRRRILWYIHNHENLIPMGIRNLLIYTFSK